MNGSSQIRSLGRLLYTQNPFYLISCGLIIYGLKLVAAGGDLDSGSTWLAVSMIGYTMLMSLTVVCVVRWGKVWEDARSIFLVVMMSQFALSVGFDILCVDNWQLGGQLLAGGYCFAVISTELVLRACRLKFPAWYRATYYLLMLVFFAAPVLSGYCVANNDLDFARWSAPLFSFAVGGCLLLLVPAIRRGNNYVRKNGTPWAWPWYPLSAFVVVMVLAGIRSHAIWMAFGSYYGGIRFEPFLLLPIVFAVFVILFELADRLHFVEWCHAAMFLAPVMLLCCTTGDGMTHMPIKAELGAYFGSAKSITFAAILSFYVYTWIRGQGSSRVGVLLTLLAASFVAPLPDKLISVGVMPWMIMLLALASQLEVCLRFKQDWQWLVLGILSGLTVVRAGAASNEVIAGWVGGIATIVAASMWIGACFETPLANRLRKLSGYAVLLAGVFLVGWHFRFQPAWHAAAGLLFAVMLAASYGVIVRRTGWVYLAAAQLSAFVIVAANLDGWTLTGGLSHPYLPIQSGVFCFVVGVTITTMKTGMRKKLCRHRGWFRTYHPGF